MSPGNYSGRIEFSGIGIANGCKSVEVALTVSGPALLSTEDRDQERRGDYALPQSSGVNITSRRTQTDEQSSFARITAVGDGSNLKCGVSVGHLCAEVAAHLRHHLIQGSNCLLDERIGAGRKVLHQDNRACVLCFLPNLRQDSPQVIPVREKGAFGVLQSPLYACNKLRIGGTGAR